jgi:hypothetical protein
MFRSGLSSIGWTLENAEDLYSTYAEVAKQAVEKDDDVPIVRALSVRHPFSRLITSGLKLYELRKQRLPDDKKDKRLFISEAGTRNVWELSERAESAVASFEKDPTLIVGSVVISGSHPLSEDDLTLQMADSICLSLAALHKAWKEGYKHVWHLKAPYNFKAGPKKSTILVTRPGVIWTSTSQPPQKKSCLELHTTAVHHIHPVKKLEEEHVGLSPMVCTPTQFTCTIHHHHLILMLLMCWHVHISSLLLTTFLVLHL